MGLKLAIDFLIAAHLSYSPHASMKNQTGE
jgi:hypothetical protein